MKSVIMLVFTFLLSSFAFSLEGQLVNEYDLEVGTWVYFQDEEFSEQIFYVYGKGEYKDASRRYLIPFRCGYGNKMKARLIDYDPLHKRIDMKAFAYFPRVIQIKECEIIKEVGIGHLEIWKETLKNKKWVKKFKKIYKKII